MSTLFPVTGKLDEKRCWDMWWSDEGSLNGVARQLENEGIVSQRTMKRYTPSAIRHAAWRWALRKENQAQAYSDINRKFSRSGRFLSEEDWKKVLVESARFVWAMTPRKAEKFIVQNGLQRYA